MTMHFIALVITQNADGEMNIKPLVASGDKAKVEARQKEFDRFRSDNQVCDIFEIEEI